MLTVLLRQCLRQTVGSRSIQMAAPALAASDSGASANPYKMPWLLTGRVVRTASGKGEELAPENFEEEYDPEGEDVPLVEGEAMPAYKELVHVLRIKRVTKVVKAGKRINYAALVVSGNGNGFVGMGQGKAVSPQKAIENAIVDARKHMIMVPLHEKTTILHRVDAKFGACKVMIKPNLPGSPLVANRTLTFIFECAGITGVTAKVHGSRTDHVMVRATLRALTQVENSEIVARKTGARIVDVEREFKKRFHNPIRLPIASVV